MKLFLVALAVIILLAAAFIGGYKLFVVKIVPPEIAYCGHETALEPDKISKILYAEKEVCTLFRGEEFATEDEAKAKYGVKISLSQEPTETLPVVTKNFTAYPNQEVKIGDKTIKILNVNANAAQFEVNGTAKTVPTGQSGTLENLDVKVNSTCGITYRTTFAATEKPCCPGNKEETEEPAKKPVEEESEMMRKVREETEEDLKASGRSGYKGVVLPKSVAREYPSTDFAVLPFLAAPSELCCGCMQEYKNLKYWGEYLSSQALIEVVASINKLDPPQAHKERKFTVVQRSESGMKFILNEINLIKQNKEYFDPSKRIPKGNLINPDYVIDGGIKFECCENSELVKVTFSAKLINAKTEKVIEELTYSPAGCFDLVKEAGRLQSVCTDFAKKIRSDLIESRFGKK